MSYILLVDDEPDITDMLEIVVNSTTSFDVIKASSGNSALKVIKEKGEPTLIVSDFKMADGDGVYLHQEITKINSGIPFIVCSGNPIDQLQTLFPNCCLYIQKPHMMKPLKEFLLSKFVKIEKKLEYVQIPLGFLRRLGVINFDTFIKINEEKYIKVHQAGDALDNNDFERIEKKYLNKLFLSKENAHVVVKDFEEFLSNKLLSEIENKTDSGEYTVGQAIQTAALLCKSLGWSQESLNMAQKTVEGTLKFIKKNKSWDKILKIPDGDDLYSYHISQIAVVSCLVANNIGWFSESTQEKLVMAALLHDQFVDEKSYEDLTLLATENKSPSAKTKYSLHPFQAAELARSLKGIPSNVDSIIMEHHERPNGDGFPRGLSASRISALGALFIICEELILFVADKKPHQISLDGFFDIHPEFMFKDPFKKIANSMKNGV